MKQGEIFVQDPMTNEEQGEIFQTRQNVKNGVRFSLKTQSVSEKVGELLLSLLFFNNINQNQK